LGATSTAPPAAAAEWEPTLSTAAFSPALFRFLRELKENNDREWFAANKERYLRDLRDPALEFVVGFGPRLLEISPHFRADPRPSGGALFRIHRDVRFSHDKSPYKTAAGLHFPHARHRSAHTPGFYLHLEPRGCFVGAGIWRPDTATLKRLRTALDADPAAWREAVGGRAFVRRFRLMDERLKRVPRGFAPDHPLADALRLKSFTALAPLTQAEVTGRDFPDLFAQRCGEAAPLVKWVCRALELPF